MSTQVVRRTAARRLAAAGVGSPEADADLLLAHVLGISRGALATARPPDAAQLELFELLLARRLLREPLQHLTGTATFRRVELRVGAGVFVPRPETELLAGWAIDHAGRQEAAVVVDLCTGSGAIAAAVVDEVPTAEVFAVEVSPEAYAYAVANLADRGVDVRLGDIAAALPELDGRCDIVVANPPYVPLVAYEEVAVEARGFDPALALWSGPDGLDTIRLVSRVAARLLRPGGVVGCEHADVQGAAAPGVFRDTAVWTDVTDHRDLADRPRYLTARRR